MEVEVDLEHVLRRLDDPDLADLARQPHVATLYLGHWAAHYDTRPIAVLAALARALPLVPTAAAYVDSLH